MVLHKIVLHAVVRQQTANNMDGVCVKTIEKLYTGDGCLGSLFPPMGCLRKKYVLSLLECLRGRETLVESPMRSQTSLKR